MIAGTNYRAAKRALEEVSACPEHGVLVREIEEAAWDTFRVRLHRSMTQRHPRSVVTVLWSGERARQSPGGHLIVVDGPWVLCPKEGRSRALAEYLKRFGGRTGAFLGRKK